MELNDLEVREVLDIQTTLMCDADVNVAAQAKDEFARRRGFSGWEELEKSWDQRKGVSRGTLGGVGSWAKAEHENLSAVGLAGGTSPGRVTAGDLENWFSYHAPEGDDLERYQAIRSYGKLFAERIVDNCPPGADCTAAIRKVREAVMTANAAIACRERKPVPVMGWGPETTYGGPYPGDADMQSAAETKARLEPTPPVDLCQCEACKDLRHQLKGQGKADRRVPR